MERSVGLLCMVTHLLFDLYMQVEVDYTETEVSISGYPLSAALTCTKLCTAFEGAWNIQ